MKIRIEKGRAEGTAAAPPSKSMAHRLLILAGLSGEKCAVHGISDSQDILATIDCLKALGVKCEKAGDTVTVCGINIREAAPSQPLNCRESGSTLRFFIPIALMTGRETEFFGSARLLERPLGIYEEICMESGFEFERGKGSLRVCGKLKSGMFTMDGNISSQFITGLLLTLPMLDEDSRIVLRPPVESRSYIDMTIEALRLFGAEAQWDGENEIAIKGGSRYSAKEVFTEGDYSNAAFFEALNYIGGDVKIENLRENSLQGDRVYKELFARMNNAGENIANIDITDCPDLGPVLMALAAASGRGARFTGTDRLKIKESSRGEAMAEELRKFGVSARLGENEITIEPCSLSEPVTCLNGHNDHRIVMAEAVLLTKTGGVIDGAEAVNKSFPDFFERLSSLGIEVKKIED